MKNIQTALFLADQHYPHHDKKVFSITKKIAKDLKPDNLVLLGDCFDAEGISKFTLKDWKVGAYETLKEIIDFKNNYYLPLIEACGNNKLKIKYCLGNHDGRRIDDFLLKIRQKECFAAHKDWKEKFNLKKFFSHADIKEYNQCHRIGKLYLTHGEYHNDAHAKKHVVTYGKSVLYGHLHTWDVKTVATKANNRIHTAYSMPCSTKLNPYYMKNRASSWVQGLMVGYFFPNGNFNLVPVIIINGKTIFNGKEYSA